MSNNTNSFDNKRRAFGALFGPIVAIILWYMPINGLTPVAHHLLAIMSLVAIWWITEPVPIPVTSLLGPTLCVILGVAPVDKAFGAFANPMIFLFLGGFLLAKGMMVNGLDKRIAYGILSMKWVGDSPRRIFLAIGLACIICSGWISNTATAAMMFPIALGLLDAIRDMMATSGRDIDLKKYKYSTGLMLMTAYACSIGGVLTPIGTPPNIMMIGFLDQLAPGSPDISFFQWMIWGVVAMVLYFAVAYFVLWRMFPADVKHIDHAREFIQERAKSLGKWNRAQVNTLIAFAVAVVLWVVYYEVLRQPFPGVHRGHAGRLAAILPACRHEREKDDIKLERRHGRYRLGYTTVVWRRTGDGRTDVYHRPLRLDWRRH